MQHHLHQVRPRTSRGNALRRRISIRREESHLRLARSTVALLQSGGNSRLQVSAQSTFAQRCCQVLALPEVSCSYETIVFAVAIVLNDILFKPFKNLFHGYTWDWYTWAFDEYEQWLDYKCTMRIYASLIIQVRTMSYAKCRLFCWGLLSVVEELSNAAKVSLVVSHLDTFLLFVFVIRYLF